jgi:hypothetical protein
MTAATATALPAATRGSRVAAATGGGALFFAVALACEAIDARASCHQRRMLDATAARLPAPCCIDAAVSSSVAAARAASHRQRTPARSPMLLALGRASASSTQPPQRASPHAGAPCAASPSPRRSSSRARSGSLAPA